MGQSKRRGTFEERRQQAIARKSLALKEVLDRETSIRRPVRHIKALLTTAEIMKAGSTKTKDGGE